MPTTVKCPNCDKPVVWQASSKYRPFCSDRCRLIDLGQWAEEQHRISEKVPEAPNSLDIEEIEAMLARQNDDFFKP